MNNKYIVSMIGNENFTKGLIYPVVIELDGFIIVRNDKNVETMISAGDENFRKLGIIY